MNTHVKQREVQVVVDGVTHTGRYEVQDFNKGGHSVVVYFRGKRAEDKIPVEVNYPAYTNHIAETLLERLVLNSGSDGD